MSDANFAGDKTELPVYMTIGNLSSKIRQMPSMRSIVMVALLPIPNMNCNIPQKRLNEQWQTNWEVLNEVLWWVLQPLSFIRNPGAESRDYNVLCTDGNFKRCKPDWAAWLADCPDYSDLHYFGQHVCFWCKCPQNELWEYVPPDKQHPWQDHNEYRMLSDANTEGANA